MRVELGVEVKTHKNKRESRGNGVELERREDGKTGRREDGKLADW
jgi:hypothetical protein